MAQIILPNMIDRTLNEEVGLFNRILSIELSRVIIQIISVKKLQPKERCVRKWVISIKTLVHKKTGCRW